MSVVLTKPGVEFAVIAPGGFRILEAISVVARAVGHDLTITSGTDGLHSGPDDPHHRGEAYDIRTHDLGFVPPLIVLSKLQDELGSIHFFAFLEDPGTENAHVHVQVRKGTVYPSPDSV